MTENQHGAFVVNGCKPNLDPAAHCIFMNAEQLGDLFNRVISVDFNEAVVGMTFSHGLPKQ
jgi:hypothetical protein